MSRSCPRKPTVRLSRILCNGSATRSAMTDWDVLFQMPFIHDGMRGTADFIERVIDPETGAVSFEPIDSKLTRTAAKPGHVLQLCFYADGIEALTGIAPERMHIWLGSGHQESLRVTEFRPYWRRLRQRLARELEAGPTAVTEPEPCAHCQFCEFSPDCDKQWREERSTFLVARIRTAEKSVLIRVQCLHHRRAGRYRATGRGREGRAAGLVEPASLIAVHCRNTNRDALRHPRYPG